MVKNPVIIPIIIPAETSVTSCNFSFNRLNVINRAQIVSTVAKNQLKNKAITTIVHALAVCPEGNENGSYFLYIIPAFPSGLFFLTVYFKPITTKPVSNIPAKNTPARSLICPSLKKNNNNTSGKSKIESPVCWNVFRNLKTKPGFSLISTELHFDLFSP